MNLEQIRTVMRKYGKAWENQDTNILLECFTRKGIYQESPLAKPYKGHDEIKRFWDSVVKEETKDIKFTLGRCYVSEDGKTGFAEWECKNKHKWKKDGKWKKEYMTGIMVLKMKGEKIRYLNEYWNTRIL